MKTEWVRACRAEKIRLDDGTADVALPRGRSQRVLLSIDERELTMRSIVARADRLEPGASADELAWRANRGARLATFQTDTRGRIVGYAVLPLLGLEPAEVVFRLKLLAEECDRLEYRLTGRDVE